MEAYLVTVLDAAAAVATTHANLVRLSFVAAEWVAMAWGTWALTHVVPGMVASVARTAVVSPWKDWRKRTARRLGWTGP